MCGIFGVKLESGSDAAAAVFAGLKRLEYRGYDSWGIAALQGENFLVSRETGKLPASLSLDAKASLAIGHNRWATHGKVSKQNSHPHLSCDKRIAIVHNGIIENFEELKKELQALGHVFSSETDSEVIAHLVEEHSKEKQFKEACAAALARLKGSFATTIANTAGELVAARQASPLVVGKTGNDFFVASDANALAGRAKEIFFLSDGEAAVLGRGMEFYNFRTMKPLKKTPKENHAASGTLEKNGFRHFMLKEIFEQPRVLQKILSEYAPSEKISFGAADRLLSRAFQRIVFVACGTSWHAALVAAQWIEFIAQIHVDVDYASEFRYKDPLVGKSDLVIAISQSGETADTLAALREAKKKGARTLALCNVKGSSLEREADENIALLAGPEIGVASTKAFTAQLCVLFLLSLFLAERHGKISKQQLKEMLSSAKKLPQAVQAALDSGAKDARAMAAEISEKRNALFLGRGLNHAVALEGALKLKELSYIHAEGMPAAEMKHGPIALIDREMPSIFVAPKDRCFEKVLSNMQEIKAREGIILAISSGEDASISRLSDFFLSVPNVAENLSPFVTVIPLQLLAYHCADLKGLDVDKPRNLAKSVTVE